jgi:hypothetical protein
MSLEQQKPDKTIDQVLADIQVEQGKIGGNEANSVHAMLRIADYLAALRVMARKTWAKQLKKVGISPRVAARYLKVASTWLTRIGLNESDLELVANLPMDLMKLEWLCRLDRSVLEDLLSRVSAKHTSRTKIIEAVCEALGQDPPTKKPPSIKKLFERVIRGLAEIGEVLEGLRDNEDCDQLCARLQEALGQIQEALPATAG